MEVDKIASVGTITRLAELIGEQTVDEFNRPLYGGHSLRTGGAVALSAMDIDLAKIEAMARWNSPMILRYAKTAPLVGLTAQVRDKALEQSHTQKLQTELTDLRGVIQRLNENLLAVQAKDEIQESKIADLEARNEPSQYVLNVWVECMAQIPCL